VSTVLERYSCGCRILFSPEGGRIPDWCDRHSGGGTPIRWISREEAEELYPDEIRLGERMLRELANAPTTDITHIFPPENPAGHEVEQG